MSCDGERRKKNFGYGSDYRYAYLYKDGQLPLHRRLYRRKCDKPPIEWILNKVERLEAEIEKLRPPSLSNPFITKEECRSIVDKMLTRGRWYEWRRR